MVICISSSFLKDIFSGYIIPDWQSLSFNYKDIISLSSGLNVFDKCMLIKIVLLQIRYHFSAPSFPRIFSPFLFLNTVNVYFWEFLKFHLFGVHWASWIKFVSFIKFKSFQLLFHQKCFCTNLFLFFLWAFNDLISRAFDILPQISEYARFYSISFLLVLLLGNLYWFIFKLFDFFLLLYFFSLNVSI